MIISRRKFEKAYERAQDEAYARQERERMWSSHLQLKEKVDKLEQRFNCHINGEPEPKEAPPVVLNANPF